MPHPHPSARRRAVLALAMGFVCGAVLKFVATAPWEVAVLVGWDVAALVNILWVVIEVHRHDAEGTAELATREDNSRVAADALLVTSSVVSLVGVGFGLVRAARSQAMEQAGITALTVLTVVLSWAVVQCVYTLRYAHLYFSGRKGIEFNYGDGEAPDYRDFFHLAVTVGMTYQVADTDITDPRIRRTLTSHALLSYLFGVVVVAMTINAVAGLLNQ